MREIYIVAVMHVEVDLVAKDVLAIGHLVKQAKMHVVGHPIGRNTILGKTVTSCSLLLPHHSNISPAF